MVYGVGAGGVMQTTDAVVRLGGAGAMAGGVIDAYLGIKREGSL